MINKLEHKTCLAGIMAIALFTGANSASAQANPVENIQPVTASVAAADLLPQPTLNNSVSSNLENPIAQDMETSPDSDNRAIATADQPAVASPRNVAQSNAEGNRVAQTVVSPGRSTRSGPSYIGIGGNIGLGGDTSLGDSGFAVISKIGLTRTISARPSVVIGGNDPTIVLPVTLDFPISSVLATGELNLEAAPYVGGGIAISTGSGSVVRPVISAGIDVPVADRVTATAGVNFAFFDDTEIGLVLGAGYRF